MTTPINHNNDKHKMNYSDIEKIACEEIGIDLDTYHYMKSEKEKNNTRFGTVAEILYAETTGYINGYNRCLSDRPTPIN